MIALLVEDPAFGGDKWRDTGFNVFLGSRVLPRQENSMENIGNTRVFRINPYDNSNFLSIIVIYLYRELSN